MLVNPSRSKGMKGLVDRVFSKQRPGFSVSHIHVANLIEILNTETFRLRHDTKKFSEIFFVARNREWAMVTETVFLFRFRQKLYKYRVVQTGGAYDKPAPCRSHTHCYVTCGNVWWRVSGGDTRFVAPPEEHLPDSDNATDFEAVSG
ncbi:unnamed protein product [Lupinus luteus]|uniref:Uncharacterized protein n=1 Tax=Lupinus luteus TaxID=3873 RepID=A0AAV1W5F8_LUPLU